MKVRKLARRGKTITLTGSFQPGDLRKVLAAADAGLLNGTAKQAEQALNALTEEGEPAMPMNRQLYPANWEEISHHIRFERAGGRCEGTPDYPDCRAEHGQPHPDTGSIVILTTAHLGTPHPNGTPGDKHDKMDVRPENLAALCQRCHLNYDRDEHLANAAATRRRQAEEAGQIPMKLEE